MKCRCLVVLALCVGFLTVGTPASADIIIDENFDALPLINSPQFEVFVTSMNMGMWWGGAPSLNMMWGVVMVPPNMAMGALLDMGVAISNLPTMGMGMVGMGWWSSLTFFAAKPAAGWGESPLELSFDYELNALGFPDGVDLLSPTTRGNFGVYAWPEGAQIPLQGVEYPGLAAGVELISGDLPPTDPLIIPFDPAGGTYGGDLRGFGYIGVTFTIGDPDMPLPEGEFLAIDDVLLRTGPAAVIPEPATIGLAAIAIAAAAHRLRRRKRA